MDVALVQSLSCSGQRACRNVINRKAPLFLITNSEHRDTPVNVPFVAVLDLWNGGSISSKKETSYGWLFNKENKCQFFVEIACTDDSLYPWEALTDDCLLWLQGWSEGNDMAICTKRRRGNEENLAKKRRMCSPTFVDSPVRAKPSYLGTWDTAHISWWRHGLHEHPSVND